MEQEEIIYVNTIMDAYKQQEYLELLKACHLTIMECFKQDVKTIDFRTYIGKGKVQEIQESLHDQNITSIYFDVNLTPLQVKNLEEVFQIPVIDREELILEIFHRRATTKVAKLQIELAQLKKTLPRLIGSNTQLSRQSGGKNKGTGEKQLELDRRRIKARISELQKELKQVKKERETQRRQRSKAQFPLVALVGYTNAGKSTIMNAFLNLSHQKEEKQVLQKDMLFATLDTTVRRISTKATQDFLLSDTVGFVSDLPHHLMEAFQSTLEEITYADLLLQVVDASNEDKTMQMETTMHSLQDLHVSHLPMITIYNKCDQSSYPYPQIMGDQVYMSASQNVGMEELLQLINKKLFFDNEQYTLLLPYEQNDLFSFFIKSYKLQQVEHLENGTRFMINLSKKEASKYHDFIVSEKSK